MLNSRYLMIDRPILPETAIYLLVPAAATPSVAYRLYIYAASKHFLSGDSLLRARTKEVGNKGRVRPLQTVGMKQAASRWSEAVFVCLELKVLVHAARQPYGV